MESLGEATPAQAYFTQIEEHFSRLRGRPLLLAPRDVALVKQWREADVPLEVVLRALDRFFAREAKRDRPRRISPSLQYVERDVYELWDDWQQSHLGDDAAGSGSRQRAVVESHLELAAHRLAARADALAAAATDDPTTGLAQVLSVAAGKLRRLAKSRPTGESVPTAEAVEQALGRVEARILRAARAAVGEPAIAELRAAARRRVATHGGGLDDKAVEVLLRKAEERELLARFEIPRIVLHTF